MANDGCGGSCSLAAKLILTNFAVSNIIDSFSVKKIVCSNALSVIWWNSISWKNSFKIRKICSALIFINYYEKSHENKKKCFSSFIEVSEQYLQTRSILSGLGLQVSTDVKLVIAYFEFHMMFSEGCVSKNVKAIL